MWQEIAIILIGIIIITYLGRKIYRFIVHPAKGQNSCSGCCGCTLKQEVNKKKYTCCK